MFVSRGESIFILLSRFYSRICLVIRFFLSSLCSVTFASLLGPSEIMPLPCLFLNLYFSVYGSWSGKSIHITDSGNIVGGLVLLTQGPLTILVVLNFESYRVIVHVKTRE